LDNVINVNPLRYAIIKPRSDGRGYGGLDFVPDTAPLQDSPSGTGKGAQVEVRPELWRYIEKINTPADYGYTRAIGKMWINSPYAINTPYSTAKAESLSCGCNIVAYTDETSTHVKLLSRPWGFDTSKLNPEIDNWHNYPYLFWKAQAISPFGQLIKVGEAQDVYFPLIHNTELWMAKSMIELFPVGPRYRFYGLNVYDRDKPLLIVNSSGRHFYNGFRINTPSLIPPRNWI